MGVDSDTDWGTRDEASLVAGRYLAGLCTAFAVAVHRRTGWPLAVLRTEDGGYAHCGCVSPDGRYVDARGFLDEAGFRDQFGGGEIVSPFDEARALLEHPQPERLIERAALHADMLLDLPGEAACVARMSRFAQALEALCREHGVWLRGPGPGVSAHVVAYEAYGEEGPYEVVPMVAGGYMVHRTLGGRRG